MTAGTRSGGAARTPPGPADDVLDSWKDIATYLQRDVRTVMRWEHTRALPVHRLPGGPKAAVYALKTELEAWRARSADDAEGIEHRVRFHRAVVVVAGALALVLVGAALTGRFARRGAQPNPIRSLAVLPFENLTRDPSQDYFVDGIHEALITDLARSSGARVVSRTSTTPYRGTQLSARDIAHELHVEGLVEGSVLRVGDRVRITAQLIRADSDEHVWAGSYERSTGDALRLISDVSEAITGEIHEVVASGSNPRPLRPPPLVVRADALDAYLRGRYAFHTMTPDGLRTALTLSRKAVAADPGFARAWAALASAYTAQAFISNAAPADVLPEARDAARRAVALDDRLGEAHGVLGYVALYWDWDFETAGKMLAKAVELSPDMSGVRHEYADYLLVTGNVAASLEQMRIAHRNDPLSLAASGVFLYHALVARQYEEVVSEGRKIMAASRASPAIHDFVGRALWLNGRHLEALAEWRLALDGDDEGYRLIERAVRAGNPRAALLARADRAAAGARNGLDAPVYAASWFAAAADADRAFEWLEQAYARRDPLLLHIVAEPFFDPIRSDRRFTDLLDRIGLKPPAETRTGAEKNRT